MSELQLRTPGWEEDIVCPECGEADQEWCDYPRELIHDGDEADWMCDACGAELRVKLCVSWTYRTTKREHSSQSEERGQ